MIHSKTYEKWSNRLRKDRIWKESEIRSLRKAMGPSGLRERAERTSLQFEFSQIVPEDGFRITREQSRKGTNYLRNRSLRADGTPRTGCKLGQRELAILANCVEHRFVDLQPLPGTGGVSDFYTSTRHLVPVYRCIARNGDSFDYLGVSYEQLQVVR